MKQVYLLIFSFCTLLVGAQIDQSLVAHYMFNDDYSDASGNGHTGTSIGGPEFVEGISGKAVMFHGIEASEPEAVNTGIQFKPEGSFSISLFFKLNKFEVDAKFQNVLVADRGEGSEGFQIRQYANAEAWPEITDKDGGWLCFTTRGIGSDMSFDPREGPESTDIKYAEDMPYMEAIYPSGFVHMVAVVDMENMKKQIWLDKVLVVDANITSPDVYGWAFDGDYVLVGARNDGTGSGTIESTFNGAIDELRIYEKALNQSDVEAIYSATVSTSVQDVSSEKDGLIISSINGSLTYKHYLTTAGSIQTSIYDMSGRLVKEAKLNANAGLNTIELGTSELLHGVYIVKVITEGNSMAQKVIIR